MSGLEGGGGSVVIEGVPATSRRCRFPEGGGGKLMSAPRPSKKAPRINLHGFIVIEQQVRLTGWVCKEL